MVIGDERTYSKYMQDMAGQPYRQQPIRMPMSMYTLQHVLIQHHPASVHPSISTTTSMAHYTSYFGRHTHTEDTQHWAVYPEKIAISLFPPSPSKSDQPKPDS